MLAENAFVRFSKGTTVYVSWARLAHHAPACQGVCPLDSVEMGRASCTFGAERLVHRAALQYGFPMHVSPPRRSEYCSSKSHVLPYKLIHFRWMLGYVVVAGQLPSALGRA